MKSYCLKCRKNTEYKNSKRISKTSNGRTMILSKCAICDGKKSRSKRTIKQFRCQKTIKYQYWVKFCFNMHAKLYKNE